MAETYVAKEAKIDRRAKPYDWYLDLVVAGAELHVLPKAYIDTVREVQAIPDPISERPERLEAIEQLVRCLWGSSRTVKPYALLRRIRVDRSGRRLLAPEG